MDDPFLTAALSDAADAATTLIQCRAARFWSWVTMVITFEHLSQRQKYSIYVD